MARSLRAIRSGHEVEQSLNATQNVGSRKRRLNAAAVNNPLLMRVLNGAADLDENVEPLACGKIALITVLGHFDAPHQLHHEKRPAHFSRTGIEYLRNVRVIHHRQRLALGLETGDDTLARCVAGNAAPY